MNNNYGKFKDSSFILQRVDTPRAWYHLLSNQNYLLQISQLGSGFSVYRTILGNMVTRQSWPDDDAGRFFYIRDRKTGKFWSPTVWPVETETSAFKSWTCAYSFGSVRWDLSRDGLDIKLTVSVSPDDDVEMYRMEITNTSSEDRDLDIFFFLEWLFSGAPGELGHSLSCDFDRKSQSLVADLEVPPQYRFHQTGFMASSEPVCGYDANRRDFLGQPGSISAPAAVRLGKCRNLPHKRLIENSCGAIQTRVSIKKRNKKSVTFLVGVCQDRKAVAALRRKYSRLSFVESQTAKMAAWWNQFVSKQIVSVSEKRYGNRKDGDPIPGNLIPWVNTWLKVQVEQNFRFTRWAGARGYRDVLQDSAGLCLLDPARARRRIVEALSHQKISGYAPRQYPVEPWKKYDWRDYRDSPFWVVYGLEKYLKETGDTGLLSEPVGFFDSQETDTVFGHARRSVDYLWQERGEHGLCLLGQGDWLDSLNAAGTGGKGESVWLSMALCYALREMQSLAVLAGEPGLSERYEKRFLELAAIINSEGWDGEWYLMAYNDIGEKIGSRSCSGGGKIFLPPQSWAVLAGIADKKRAARVMAACKKYLKFDTGYLCFAPMYRRFEPHVGRICLWPSEGASVYSHATLFKVAADCLLGEADRAWETIKLVVPAGGLLPPEDTGAEPFTVPNAYMGPQWPRPRWTYQGWWTATADWTLQAIVEGIFGACADYEGLRINPALPSAWREARIIRHFRGDTYDIRITKPEGICRGRVTLCLDGKKMPGNLIRPKGDGRVHRVEARIAKK